MMISHLKLLILLVQLLTYPFKVEPNSMVRQAFWEEEAKRRNFVLYGVEHPVDETPDELWETVMEILTKRMEVDVSKEEIDCVMRLGQDNGTRRPVLVKCTTEWRRNEIMKRDYKLKGTSVFIEPDLNREEVRLRKIYIRKMHEYRAQGIHAVVMKGKLMVNRKHITVPTTTTDPSLRFLHMNRDGTVPEYVADREFKSNLELEQKRKNFVMYGVEEEPFEKFTELRNCVLHILNNILHANVSMLEIDNMWRLGREHGGSRPILVKMINEWRKKDIMSKRVLLKGTQIFLTLDLTKEKLKARKREGRFPMYNDVEYPEHEREPTLQPMNTGTTSSTEKGTDTTSEDVSKPIKSTEDSEVDSSNSTTATTE